MADFKDLLNTQIEEVAHKFDEAKNRAIEELQKLNTNLAAEYGAGYAIHIDEVTKYAAELQRLSKIYRVYENFEAGRYAKIEIGE